MHVVVKNAAFTIKVGLLDEKPDSVLDLNNLMFRATLLYDNDDQNDTEEKPVDYISVEPLEMRRCNAEPGRERARDSVSFAVKIKVLSSHHENLLFRVKIAAINPVSGLPLGPYLHVVSGPIRVISKPEKKTRAAAAAAAAAAPAPEQKKQKLTKEQRLKSALRAVDEQQQQQQRLIAAMLQHVTNFGPGMPGAAEMTNMPAPQAALPPNGSWPNSACAGDSAGGAQGPAPMDTSELGLSAPVGAQAGDSGSMDVDDHGRLFSDMLGSATFGFDFDFDPSIVVFDNAFETFILLYNTLQANERSRMIRKIIRNSGQAGVERLTAFLKALSAASMKANRQKGSACSCAVCPYQHQLERMEKDPFLNPSDMAEVDASGAGSSLDASLQVDDSMFRSSTRLQL